MWDAIRKNKRRSYLLLIFMFLLMIALGVSIGLAVNPEAGGPIGGLVALGIYLLMVLIAYAQGDQILLSTAGARQISKEDMPQYWNVVEEMTIASGMGKMPAVYIMETSVPNAFAVGRNPETAAVAVTSGLLKKLNRDELQGVIAHEIGHIRNQDVRFMTLAGVMMGTIIMMSEMVFRGMFYTARFGGRRFQGRSRSSGSGGGGQAQIIFLAVAILLAILAPILAQLLYFACSRKREYLADASGALYTRYPEGLASALERISSYSGKMKDVSRALVPMYIVNPLQAHGRSGLFSTHPPTTERVDILRAMSGAGWMAYEAAYKQVRGEKRSCIDSGSLKEAPEAPIREAAEKQKGEFRKKEKVERLQQVNDMLAGMGSFIFLTCACSLRIKVPAEYKGNEVQCPRCNRVNPIIPTS